MIILGQEGMANSNQPKNSTLLDTHETVTDFDPGLDLEIQRHNYEDIDRPTDLSLGMAQSAIPSNPNPFLQISNRDQAGSILSTPSPFMRTNEYGIPNRLDNIPPHA